MAEENLYDKFHEEIKQFYCLGTIIQLTAYGHMSKAALNRAQERLNEIDDKMSAFKNYSEISKLNKSAGKAYEKVTSDTYFVIKKALEYSKLSEGNFDPTIRPLVNLWNIGKENFRIPSESEIQEKLKLVNYKDIFVNEEKSEIMLKKEGQKLDVGGIAKGYAADEVVKILKEYHIQSGLINLGGNVFAFKKKLNNENWNIGIQNPFDIRGQCVGVVSVSNKSVVTSGNYERYSEIHGKKFQHIIDAKNGYPTETNVVSATIISDKSIVGDGLSTGVYIMGAEEGIKLINTIAKVEAIFITKDKKVYITSGIKDKFKLTSPDFSYI
ncbi:thiamine biosynthesis lipoprotein ApbE precursor [Clostridium puniceum]|uniref:FAD:protein FMN transferase n=1 Tax=Clostridium puniceum TaxID=29367 RepID=A0A1S8T7F1_9CLOT|nr:FAD:protein FMN transferase [Clostridium puniceum]OOM73544.1 thiamine biosynthesis lipoprotein ApbE precursor [Clostridium puniceum]